MLNSLTFFLMGVLAISEKDITQDYIFKHMGLWMHPSQQYAVRLEGCENGMCGTIAWVSEAAVKRDVNNKDEILKGRSLCGLRIVEGLATDGHVNIYKKGKMYRTDNGQNTSVKASYLSSDEVQMHSYLGVSMVGDTQTWLRVNEKDYPPCTPLTPLSAATEPETEVEKPRARGFMPDVASSSVVSSPIVSSEPISLVPHQQTVVSTQTPRVVIQETDEPEAEAMTTNTNLKTRAVDQVQQTVASTQKISKQKSTEPQILTLEVIE